jgi:hypothetical protein
VTNYATILCYRYHDKKGTPVRLKYVIVMRMHISCTNRTHALEEQNFVRRASSTTSLTPLSCVLPPDNLPGVTAHCEQNKMLTKFPCAKLYLKLNNFL